MHFTCSSETNQSFTWLNRINYWAFVDITESLFCMWLIAKFLQFSVPPLNSESSLCLILLILQRREVPSLQSNSIPLGFHSAELTKLGVVGNLCVRRRDVWIYLATQTASKEEKAEERKGKRMREGRDTGVRTYAHKKVRAWRSNTYPVK